MADSCASCRFWIDPPAASGLSAGVKTCNRHAPEASAQPGVWPWMIVDGDFWCGDGADSGTGLSFAAGVYNLPATALASAPWTAYVPALSVGAGALTAAAAIGSYLKLGSLVAFCITIAITTNGTAAGFIDASLPIGAVAGAFSAVRTTDGFGLAASLQGSGVRVTLPDATYPGVDGAVMVISGTYEEAI